MSGAGSKRPWERNDRVKLRTLAVEASLPLGVGLARSSAAGSDLGICSIVRAGGGCPRAAPASAVRNLAPRWAPADRSGMDRGTALALLWSFTGAALGQMALH